MIFGVEVNNGNFKYIVELKVVIFLQNFVDLIILFFEGIKIIFDGVFICKN